MDQKNFTTILEQRIGDPRAKELLDALAGLIKEQALQGHRLALPGFGTFEGIKNDEEMVTDLSTGKRMLLPPSIDVSFQSGAMLRKRIKEGKR